jgi:cytidylate kinase
MGSCGSTTAAAVAKALDYDYVDRQAMVDAAEASVLDAAIAEAAEWRLLAWLRFNEEKIRYRTSLEAAFFGFVAKDNVVTAGRRIAALAPGVGHAVRIGIIAPFEVRVERIWGRRLPHTLDLSPRRHQPNWSGI